MSDYEQMEIDVRLESEKSLKDNVSKVIQFTYDKRNLEAEENGRPIPAVRNKHEGYGIAAEAWSKIQFKGKGYQERHGRLFGASAGSGRGCSAAVRQTLRRSYEPCR